MSDRKLNYNQSEKLGRQYRLIRRLGQGGMGEVWLAENVEETGEPVALKLLLKNSDSLRDRFYEEARAHRNLIHPNIVTMHGFEDSGNDSPYLITEYMPGGSLDRFLEAAGASSSSTSPLPSRLSRELVLSMVLQVADALEHMHLRDFAHRDLKTSNLLLREPLGMVLQSHQCTLKLADLGIADSDSSVRAELTQTGDFVGSFQYAAPEYLRRYLDFHKQRVQSYAQFDRPLKEAQKGDIFALGLIWYELWMGVRFFELNKKALARKSISQSVDLARETNEALLAALERFRKEPPASIVADEEAHALLEQMLKADPAVRPGAEEIRDRLKQQLTQQVVIPVTTYSGSRSEGERQARRRAAVAPARARVFGAGAALALAGGVGLASWQGVIPDLSGILSLGGNRSEAAGAESRGGGRGATEGSGQKAGSTLDSTSKTGTPGVGGSGGSAPGGGLERGGTPAERALAPAGKAGSPVPGNTDRKEASVSRGVRPWIPPFALRSPLNGVQGVEKRDKKGVPYLEFEGRPGATVGVPAEGSVAKLFRDSRYPDGELTRCLVLRHVKSYYSLVCGLGWDTRTAPVLDQELEPGASLAKVAASGRVTLRVYEASGASEVGENKKGRLQDITTWMVEGSMKP